MLAGAGANVEAKDSDGDGAMGMASANGHTAVVAALLAAGAAVGALPAEGDLRKAAKAGSDAEVTRLLAAGADANAEAEAEVSKKGSTPLHIAAVFGFPSICTRLVAAGAYLEATNTKGFTALMLAAMNVENATNEQGKLATVQALLKAGAGVNAKTIKASTSVTFATNNNFSTIVAALRAAGGE